MKLNVLIYHYPSDAAFHAKLGRIDHEPRAALVAEFGHLQGGIFGSSQRPGSRLAVGMQLHLLCFQRGRDRRQGGFGSARVVERILLTSGIGGLVAAPSVMAVGPSDCVMLLRR